VFFFFIQKTYFVLRRQQGRNQVVVGLYLKSILCLFSTTGRLPATMWAPLRDRRNPFSSVSTKATLTYALEPIYLFPLGRSETVWFCTPKSLLSPAVLARDCWARGHYASEKVQHRIGAFDSWFRPNSHSLILSEQTYIHNGICA